MAHPKLDMEDSDSDYDPSKIPSNPPKAISARPVSAAKQEPPTATTTMAAATNNLSDAIISEAERDWEAIDNVCSRPMFAPTEEVKRALDLLRKWTEGAEARYGTEIMSYLKRKIIGPAAEARKTELQRMLFVRAQANGEKQASSAEGHVSPYTQPTNILPPIKPRAESETMSPSTARPIQNGNLPYTNGIQQQQARPAAYQPDRRPQQPRAPSLTIPQSHPPQQNSLPPIQTDPPRPVTQYQNPSRPAYPPPAYPVRRGTARLYSPESDLYCSYCRVGPLNCMHNHRLIGLLFARGITYSSLEELQYVREQLENWAYRGHPLKMEPAMTKTYSLEELAAEQKKWIAELRVLLASRPAEQTQPRDTHLPRPVNAHQHGYINGHARQNSTPVASPYPDSRHEDPRYGSQATMNGHDTYGRGTPASYTYATPTSVRSPAVSYPPAPREHDQGICRTCPRNSPCVHQRDDRKPSLLPVEHTNGVDHKRKRSDTSNSRRVRAAFRPEIGDVISSDDDVEDEEADGFPQAYNAHAYQKFNQVRTIVDNMPKDQLSTAILRMCYSNTMILNWMKKELNKSGKIKEVAMVGNGALITPTSPDSTTARGANSTSANHINDKPTRCGKCDSMFNAASEAQPGECQYHDGDLVPNNNSTISNRIWQDDNTKRIWTCCGTEKSAKGCQSGKHSVSPIKSTLDSADRAALSSLMGIAAGRQPVKHYSHSFAAETGSLYPGQALVKALAAAEKDAEKAALTFSPISRRSSTGGQSDVQALQDYSPSTHTLDNISETLLDLGFEVKDRLDLSADPEKHLLHKLELKLASELQLTCEVYLGEKRRIFRAVVEAMQDGSEFGIHDAQTVCRIEPTKARALYQVFERVGWFEPKHFMKFLNDPSGGMVNSIERTLPGIHSLPHSDTNSSGRPNSAPDLNQISAMARRASSGSASAPIVYAHHLDRAKKQRSPTHLPHASTLFQPLHSPGHLHAPRFMANGHHMDHGHNTVNLTDLPHTPPRDLIMAGSPETYQWRKNGNGKKMQVPICPYPRSWAEADSVDRELVRLKRHEGKQWEELFEWWRGKGRASLKNASCLAVRYSILKKNYESDWVREGL